MHANMWRKPSFGNHTIQLSRPTAGLPFHVLGRRVVSAFVRAAPLLTVCALPVLGLRWSLQREDAMRMEIHRRMKTEAAIYIKNAAARRDLLRGLAPGRPFRQPPWRDVAGRTLPVGQGAPALVWFADRTLGNALVREIRKLATQCPRSQIVIVAAEKASIMREYGRATRQSRLYFVADPSERWHEWYGATRRRAFVVDGRGVIAGVMTAPNDVQQSDLVSILKQTGG